MSCAEDINERRNGETILASWFNVLKTCLTFLERKIYVTDEDYSIGSGFNTVIVDATAGPVTITLPDQSLNSNKEFSIIAKVADNTNRVNIVPQSGLILGQSSIFLRMSNEAIRLTTEGVNWYACS